MSLDVGGYGSLKAPLRDNIISKTGLMNMSWQWFFRLVQKALYPLGIEKSFVLLNNMNAKIFASATDVNTTTDIITETAHGYFTGLKIVFTTAGTAPSPLVNATTYYIIKVDDNSYKLATTVANANNGTQIDITTIGVGNQTVTPHADITGMLFNKSGVTHTIVEYLVQRVTTGGGAVELIEGGLVQYVYEPVSDLWTQTVLHEHNPSDAGITLSITTTGQVEYLTTLITGTASISNIFWRARTLSGKNVQYSKAGR